MKQLYDGLVSASVRDLSVAASNAKKGMFDHLILKRDLDKKKIRLFLGSVNDFLTFWCDYAEELVEMMKVTKGTAGIYCLPYADVKDYIYTKYDLASVLHFADAVIAGINEKEITKSDGIKTVFVDHVNKAFAGRSDDVGGLLSEVLQNEGRPTARTIDKKEASLFNTAAKFKWYAATDHAHIYDAIEKTCTYMVEQYGLEKQLSTNDLRLYVNVINMVVEYMMYTLVAYATRIYMISLYVWPHYMAGTTRTVNSAVTESGKWDETVSTLQEADDMLLRDPKKLDKLGDKIYEFMKMIGAKTDDMGKGWYRRYYTYPTDEKIKTNEYYKALYDNELLTFLRERDYGSCTQNQISETKHRLETMCHSGMHALSTETIPKQAILHVIRGIQPSAETLEGYRKMASDLANFGLTTLYMITQNILEYERWLSDAKDYLWEGQSTKNDADACWRMSTALYREIGGAMMQRFRDIEMRFNELSGTTAADINKQLEIKIPGTKSDRSLDDNMASAVPVSTRVPLDVIQLYASPVFDEAAMYLDWLGTKPELQDYWYVSEAAGNPIDNLIAFFQSIWRRIQTFFAGNQFKNAMKWVETNRQILIELDKSQVEMEVWPYKASVKVDDHYSNLTTYLAHFNPAMIKTQEDVEKFITSLYPNETVASWFPMNGTKEQLNTGAIRWRNYTFFEGQELENVSDQPMKMIKLNTGANVDKQMRNALATVMQGDTYLKKLESLNNRIGAGIQHLKQSTIRIRMIKESGEWILEQTAPAQQGAPQGPADSQGDTGDGSHGQSGTEPPKQSEASPKASVKDQSSNNPPQGQPETETQNGVNPQLMRNTFQATQIVLQNIWLSMTTNIIKYVMDQYKSLTALYDVAHQLQNNAAQQQANNQQQGQQQAETAGT